MKKPPDFDGAKFAVKYNLDPFIDFYDNGKGEIICPSLPDLVDTDLLDCLADPLPDKEIFFRPIQAPALYADDIFVSSRKIKDDPDEAFAEAVAESEKPHGEAKSLDLITRSQTQMIKELHRKIVELEKHVKKLEK